MFYLPEKAVFLPHILFPRSPHVKVVFDGTIFPNAFYALQWLLPQHFLCVPNNPEWWANVANEPLTMDEKRSALWYKGVRGDEKFVLYFLAPRSRLCTLPKPDHIFQKSMPDRAK